MLDVYLKDACLAGENRAKMAELSLVLADETQLDILDRLEESERRLLELIFRIGQSCLTLT